MNSINKKLSAAVVILLLAVIDIGIGSLLFHHSLNHIVLKGDEYMEINLCQIYEDPGVDARRFGLDKSEKVKVESELDVETPGSYTIKYTLGSLSAERTVIVGDKMDPVISVSGGDDKVKLGEDFNEPVVMASDSKGNDLTGKVEKDISALNEAGMQEIIYTVFDSEGNGTRVSRRIDVLPNTEYDSPGLPICMYHYVYRKEAKPGSINGNYIEAGDLAEELQWLNKEGFYYPTWEEVRKYIDGELLLPEKSIVLCFDDGAESFLEEGIPVLEECRVPATCFMITSYSGPEKIAAHKSDYIYYESHSHNMHRPGGSVGHGGIFTALTYEKALEDLETSIAICGSGDAFAYPFGDYNENTHKVVEAAGFLCAVTTEYGKAYPGMDPLLLPRVRMTEGQTLSAFKDMVSP